MSMLTLWFPKAANIFKSIVFHDWQSLNVQKNEIEQFHSDIHCSKSVLLSWFHERNRMKIYFSCCEIYLYTGKRYSTFARENNSNVSDILVSAQWLLYLSLTYLWPKKNTGYVVHSERRKDFLIQFSYDYLKKSIFLIICQSGFTSHNYFYILAWH